MRYIYPFLTETPSYMRTNAPNPPKGGTMSDNRKYYYLKLKENYFDEDAIVLLESMQDGIL